MDRIFITGGASGLGRALALNYARRGWRVCIGDRHLERGEATRQALVEAGAREARFIAADVTRESDLQHVADTLAAVWGGLDVLINNAGVAQAGAITDVPLDDWQWILDINLLGVVRGCKCFTPLFQRQGSGHIVNIASMAGLLDVPRMAAYNVSKAAVVALSTTLEQELMAEGIRVSVVCPSFFQTQLAESLRSTDDGLTRMMNKLLASGRLSADDVAEHIVRGLQQGRTHILPHAAGARLWRLKRFLPHGLYRRLFQRSLRRMQPRAQHPGKAPSGGPTA